MRWCRSLLLPAAIAIAATSGAATGSPLPPGRIHAAPPAFTGYVVDQAGLLRPEARRRLTARLAAFASATRHQLVIVTVDGLDGADVSVFTRRLANRWGVGRKGIDDGIVLLVAPHEHALRLEVGNGLTHRLPNALCRRILDDALLPGLRAGRADLGLEAAVRRIVAALSDRRQERNAPIPR